MRAALSRSSSAKRAPFEAALSARRERWARTVLRTVVAVRAMRAMRRDAIFRVKKVGGGGGGGGGEVYGGERGKGVVRWAEVEVAMVYFI